MINKLTLSFICLLMTSYGCGTDHVPAKYKCKKPQIDDFLGTYKIVSYLRYNEITSDSVAKSRIGEIVAIQRATFMRTLPQQSSAFINPRYDLSCIFTNYTEGDVGGSEFRRSTYFHGYGTDRMSIKMMNISAIDAATSNLEFVMNIELSGIKDVLWSFDGSVIYEFKRINNSTTQQLNNSTTQQLNNSTTQQLNNSTTQQLNNSTTQQLNNSTTQQLNNSTTQQLNNSTTQQLNNSTTQQLNNSTTQQLNNSTTHRTGQTEKYPINIPPLALGASNISFNSLVFVFGV